MNRFKKKVFSVVLTITVLASFTSVKSQTNTLYFMDGIHQSNYLNPAYQDNCNMFIGLPALSNLNLQVGNSTFTYGNIFKEGSTRTDTTVVNINDIANAIRNSNSVYFSTTVPILDLGFWIKNSYFTFNIANKTNFKFAVPGKLLLLGIEGNGNNIGSNNPLILDKIGPQALNYHEFAFGLSKKITHRLYIGARLKILFGTANIQTKKSELKITTQEDSYDLNIETDIEANLSGPFIISRDSAGNIDDIEIDDSDPLAYALSTGNLGVAIDMGATYQFNDKFNFFASVTDLGFINWHNNLTNLTQKESFEFSGLTLDSLGTDYDEFGAIADSLEKFTNFNISNIDYTTSLNANIFLGATYEVGRIMNIGLLSKTLFFSKDVMQSFTLSTNFKPAKGFAASLSYTVSNKQFNNFGIGLEFNGGPFQLYLLTDNLSATFWPKNTKSVAFQLGLNLHFGCGKRDDFSIINNKKYKKDIDFMY